MNIVPYPYQDAAVEEARVRMRSGKRRPLIVAPTGAGKTIIACVIISKAVEKKSRTLFLAHRDSILRQTSKKLDTIGVEHGLVWSGHKAHSDRPVQVGSVATVASYLRRGKPIPGGPFSFIFIDEAHHAAADSYGIILDAFPNAYVVGLTATPYRADGEALGDTFDDLIEVATVRWLIDRGYLVEPRACGIKIPDLSDVKISDDGNDYKVADLARVMNHPALLEEIVTTWKKKALGRPTVAFAVDILHSKAIAAAFQRAGVSALHLDGSADEDERIEAMRRLEAGEITVICNCELLTEGWDMPAISCAILARPTRSRSLWKQTCGRALRPFKDKKDCIILDHAGCWKRFGFLTDPEKLSLEGSEPETGDFGEREGGSPVFSCPHCGATFPGWPRFCPECGDELPLLPPSPDHQLEQKAADLDELDPKLDRNPRVLYYMHLAEEARARGWRPFRIGIDFRERFGNYPYPEDMGPDRRLWTRYSEEKNTRVWVEDLTAPPPQQRPTLPAPANTGPRVSRDGRLLADPALCEEWRSVLDRLRAKRPALAAVLDQAALLRFDRACVVIGYFQTGAFLIGQAMAPDAMEALRVALIPHFHGLPTVRVDTLTVASNDTPPPTLASIDAELRRRTRRAR